MSTPNIFVLEEFFYKTVKAKIMRSLESGDLRDVLLTCGVKDVPFEEFFADELREEDAGKKFRYDFRRTIVPNESKYRKLFETSRRRAFQDFCARFQTEPNHSFKINKNLKKKWNKFLKKVC